ncbi:MAG: BatD family protein [Bacteroidota bacterium]
MLRIVSLSLLFCLVSSATFAQAPIRFYASSSGSKVLENQVMEVQFTLENGDGSSFSPPDFKDFRVINGPSRSMSTSIMNGQRSVEMSYGYSLMPTRTGKIRIGSASITVNGKRYKTSPIVIEVVKGKALSENEKEQVFVRAELASLEGWVGQQLILDYKLYTTVDVESYNVLEESGYQGFFPQEIRRHDSRTKTEVLEGVQYTTKVLKRVALFPQQTGELMIDPILLQVGVSKGGNRARRSLLFNPNVKRVNIQSEPVALNILPLPAASPESFTGAVGDYQVSSRISRATVTTDDVVSVRLTVQGAGDLKRIQAPPLNVPEGLELYDPKVIDEGLYESAGTLVGKKEFEYLILPKQSGTYQLQPQFAFFDPDSSRYILAGQKRYTLNVRAGTARDRQAINTDEDELSEDIHFLKLDTKLYKEPSYFPGTLGFWGAIILPFLALGGMVVRKRALATKEEVDPVLRKAQLARKEALARLEKAAQFRQSNDAKGFYDEVSKAMLGYVCDKLRIPRSELTKNNLREKLEAIKVEETRIERFMQLISTCEMALFAGKDNAAAMQDTYEGAVEILADIEKAS